MFPNYAESDIWCMLWQNGNFIKQMVGMKYQEW
jgi:hypothetical protein